MKSAFILIGCLVCVSLSHTPAPAPPSPKHRAKSLCNIASLALVSFTTPLPKRIAISQAWH